MTDILVKIRDPIFQAVVGLCSVPILLVGAYALSLFAGSWVPLYLGMAVSAVLLFPALLVSTALFLLWKNPKKYKEREMKRWRRERKGLREKK